MREKVSTKEQVLAVYERQGIEIVKRNDFINMWSANSQFGYTFDWFETEEQAINHSISFYLTRGWI